MKRGMLLFSHLTLTDILLTVKGGKYDLKIAVSISFLKYSNNFKRLVFHSKLHKKKSKNMSIAWHSLEKRSTWKNKDSRLISSVSLKKYKSHGCSCRYCTCWNARKIRFPHQERQGAFRRAGLSLGDCSTVSPCHPLARLGTMQLHLPAWVVLMVTRVLCWHRDTECDTKCGSSTGGSVLKQGSCRELELETSTGAGSSSWWELVRGQEGHWEIYLPLWSWVM